MPDVCKHSDPLCNKYGCPDDPDWMGDGVAMNTYVDRMAWITGGGAALMVLAFIVTVLWVYL